MKAYYNEIEPFAAQWLRNLIDAGEIAPGDVDERSIKDVSPSDLAGYRQCHFFAGIGGWSLALRLAGWPDDLPVWTGSCPCQPFSVAGAGRGEDDSRHLWPDFRRLIAECGPPTVFGEQVASKAGRGWLTGVLADLEGLDYAGAGADLCAAGVGAPHIRQRLFWVADSNRPAVRSGRRSASSGTPGGDSASRPERERVWSNSGTDGGRKPGGMADRGGKGLEERDGHGGVQRQAVGSLSGQDPGRSSAWSDYEILDYRDGKPRRSQSLSRPLAHGLPRSLGHHKPGMASLVKLAKASLKGAKQNRGGRLKGYGNAISPQPAVEFIRAAGIGGPS